MIPVLIQLTNNVSGNKFDLNANCIQSMIDGKMGTEVYLAGAGTTMFVAKESRREIKELIRVEAKKCQLR